MREIFDDIRQLYRFRCPTGELEDLIEFFSESESEKTKSFARGHLFTVSMFPSYTPTIWLNFGPSYQIDLGNRVLPVKKQEDILLVRNTGVTRINNPDDYIFTIKFYPGALLRLFGISQAGMNGLAINPACILPHTLIEKAKLAASFEQRVALVEHFLLSRINEQKKADHFQKLVKQSIDLFDQSSSHLATSEIAESVFLSSRSFNRYFHRVVGINPKKYFSMLKARRALSSFVADRRSFSPELHGYHDMSHFYRAMLNFTGERVPNLKK